MITTRRQFLSGGLSVAAAVPFAARLGRATDASLEGERVLVVLQLSGGNDGLNTVVPHRQDAYFRARPTLGLDRRRLVELDDDHGLHPALAPLEASWGAGHLAVVHGVGYPNPDRSHFRSMEIWHTADPDDPPGDTGWMGGLADQVAVARPGALAALHVGGGNLPLALFGRHFFTPTVRDENGFQLRSPARGFEAARATLLADAGGVGELAFLREAARTTYRAADRMASLTGRAGGGDYPNHPLARRLRLVAQLVKGGFDTRLFHVELGGFDTHSQQRPAHEALLTELGQSLGAFQADLVASGVAERVATLVFSEFGRRVAENGSKGTDHGAGAPALVLGGGVAGGLHGAPPDLDRLVEGDVPPTTDFRSLYTALSRDWLGLDPPTAHAAAPVLRST